MSDIRIRRVRAAAKNGCEVCGATSPFQIIDGDITSYGCTEHTGLLADGLTLPEKVGESITLAMAPAPKPSKSKKNTTTKKKETTMAAKTEAPVRRRKPAATKTDEAPAKKAPAKKSAPAKPATKDAAKETPAAPVRRRRPAAKAEAPAAPVKGRRAATKTEAPADDAVVEYVVGVDFGDIRVFVERLLKENIDWVVKPEGAKRFGTVAKASAWAKKMGVDYALHPLNEDDDEFYPAAVYTLRNGKVSRRKTDEPVLLADD